MYTFTSFPTDYRQCEISVVIVGVSTHSALSLRHLGLPACTLISELLDQSVLLCCSYLQSYLISRQNPL